jgi:thiamine biosynthesis lipoprotein
MAEHSPIPSEDRPPSRRLSRRDFIRIVAGVGIAGWVGKTALENLDASQIVHQTRLLMGTIVNLTLVVPGRETASAEAAVSACLSSMAELEAVLSRFKPDSQVSILNRTGILKNPHPALLDLIRQSRRISQLSAGLFDITILPVLALYQQYQAQANALPPANSIEAACSKVDYRQLSETERGLVFSVPGMGITLDGIAKGYIVDAGVSRLAEHGFTDVLVEAGGDLVASGRQSSDRPWKIGIQSPRPAGKRLVTQFNASNEAVATSGDYMQAFSTDFTQHHILDPHTGHSSTALASATVIAPRLAFADALATTLMLMDPPAGLALVKDLGLRALLVTKDLALLKV